MSEHYLQYKVLQWAFSFLKKHERDQSVAEWLLKHHLQCSDADFIMQMRQPVAQHIVKKFKRDIERHAVEGVPAQHLTGETFFYGRSFLVNKNVLIPRFDTEVLVQAVINYVSNHIESERITIVDVGTGSGIIAITLAQELQCVDIIATDISQAALRIAKKNAMQHEVDIQFLRGDFLKPIMDKGINPMIIISNPPYIREGDALLLEDTVRNFDPPLALYGGTSGLIAYEEIIGQLSQLPERSERIVCFEIGSDQAEPVTDIIKSHYKKSNVHVIKDLNNKDRVIFAHIFS